MERKLGFALAFCAAIIAQGDVIVHDAAKDLICNSANHAVYTNLYGGVWSYMRASSYTGTRTLMPGVRSRTLGDTAPGKERDIDDLPYVWQRGPAKGDASPCFQINPTAWPDVNEFMRGKNFPAIPPGQLSCHPGNTSDTGNQCCVLRFTVPRDGTYEVKAKAWNQNVGSIAVALLVNGTAVMPRVVWTSTATAVRTNDFSRAATAYHAGDLIELTFDGNNTFYSNATGFSFDVLETVEDEVIDANAVFLANKTSSKPSNSFFSDFGEWAAQYGIGTSMLRSAMSDNYVRVTQGAGLVGCAMLKSGTLQLPFLVVNSNNVMVVEKTTDTNGTVHANYVRGRALFPGEFLAHPGASRERTYYRVWPSHGGLYDIGVAARDLSKNAHQSRAQGGGVNVLLLQGGVELASFYVGTEDAPSSDAVCVRGVAVVPNIPIEVAIDCNGSHDSDGTGFFWAFVRRGELPTVLSANAAMKANMTSDSPAATWTYEGAEWSVGICNGAWSGAFTEFNVRQDTRYNGTTEGWGQTANTSPFVCVNTSGRTLTAAETGTMSAGADMLLSHPKGDNSASVIRVKIPETGIYSATGWFKDLNGGGNANDSASGVDAHVVVNGHNAVVGVACSEGSKQPYVRLASDHLHLRAGDRVTFAVGANGGYNFDLTGYYAWLERETNALRHVNFDFDVAPSSGAAATFAGAGRVGWTGEAWSSVKVANGASLAVCAICSEEDGTAARTRVGVALTLAREGGLVATAQGTANDTSAPALFTDGVVSASANAADAVTFKVEGLLPNETYDFVFYSRAVTALPSSANTVVHGVFTVGDAADESTHPWFSGSFGDYARVTAKANANGEVTGTFRSAKDANALWCGLQILGTGFAEYIPRGQVIIVR